MLQRDGKIDRQVGEIAEEFRRGFETVNRLDRPAIRSSDRLEPRPRTLRTSLPERPDAASPNADGPSSPAVVRGSWRRPTGGVATRGGLSVGFNIRLPHDRATTPTSTCAFEFSHFYARKTMFVKAAEGFVVFPGGFGTLDELYEALTLVQTA